jgi:hypothetical protein
LLRKEAQAAETHLLAAKRAAESTRQPPLEWRAARWLAHAYRIMGRSADAQREEDTALEIVNRLAGTIPDTALRETFVTRAQELIRGQ